MTGATTCHAPPLARRSLSILQLLSLSPPQPSLPYRSGGRILSASLRTEPYWLRLRLHHRTAKVATGAQPNGVTLPATSLSRELSARASERRPAGPETNPSTDNPVERGTDHRP